MGPPNTEILDIPPPGTAQHRGKAVKRFNIRNESYPLLPADLGGLKPPQDIVIERIFGNDIAAPLGFLHSAKRSSSLSGPSISGSPYQMYRF